MIRSLQTEIDSLKNENKNILRINSRENIIDDMKKECSKNIHDISTLLNSQQSFIEQINEEFKARGDLYIFCIY